MEGEPVEDILQNKHSANLLIGIPFAYLLMECPLVSKVFGIYVPIFVSQNITVATTCDISYFREKVPSGDSTS